MTGSTKFQPDLLNFRFKKSNFSTHLLRIIYKDLSDIKIGQPEMFPESVPIVTPDPFSQVRPPRRVSMPSLRFLGCTLCCARFTKVTEEVKTLFVVFRLTRSVDWHQIRSKLLVCTFIGHKGPMESIVWTIGVSLLPQFTDWVK